jgi:hypothetical protein
MSDGSPNIDPTSIPALCHAIRADAVHWTETWSFSLSGTRSSIEIVAGLSGQPSIRDAPIDVLRKQPHAWPATLMSPFATTALLAAMHRSGMRLGMGVTPYPTHWYSAEEITQILTVADRELLLEETRRNTAAEAPSRLTCLWAAEDTVAGRNWVERMMGHNSFVIPVELLAAMRAARCDAHWLELLHDRPDVAGRYWSDEPADREEPLWEYLLDGTIRARDQADVDRIKNWAAGNIPSDLLGPPSNNAR